MPIWENTRLLSDRPCLRQHLPKAGIAQACAGAVEHMVVRERLSLFVWLKALGYAAF